MTYKFKGDFTLKFKERFKVVQQQAMFPEFKLAMPVKTKES